MIQFLQRSHQVRKGTAPAIQTPYHDRIDFTAAHLEVIAQGAMTCVQESAEFSPVVPADASRSL